MATAPFDDAEVNELAAQLIGHRVFADHAAADVLAGASAAAADFSVVEEWFHGDLGVGGRCRCTVEGFRFRSV